MKPPLNKSIQDELRSLGLPTGGNKDDLLYRLADALQPLEPLRSKQLLGFMKESNEVIVKPEEQDTIAQADALVGQLDSLQVTTIQNDADHQALGTHIAKVLKPRIKQVQALFRPHLEDWKAQESLARKGKQRLETTIKRILRPIEARIHKGLGEVARYDALLVEKKKKEIRRLKDSLELEREAAESKKAQDLYEEGTLQSIAQADLIMNRLMGVGPTSPVTGEPVDVVIQLPDPGSAARPDIKGLTKRTRHTYKVVDETQVNRSHLMLDHSKLMRDAKIHKEGLSNVAGRGVEYVKVESRT